MAVVVVIAVFDIVVIVAVVFDIVVVVAVIFDIVVVVAVVFDIVVVAVFDIARFTLCSTASLGFTRALRRRRLLGMDQGAEGVGGGSSSWGSTLRFYALPVVIAVYIIVVRIRWGVHPVGFHLTPLLG